MGKSRLEAFSDGVIAIIITIMVLDLKVPRGSDLAALRPVVPTFLTYVLSFVFTGIYWTNHHHMFLVTKRVTGGILWANLHLLFWLSVVPFVTEWMGENHFAAVPTACYGIVLLMNGVSYSILQRAIIVSQGSDSVLAAAIGKDLKGNASLVLYVVAVTCALLRLQAISCALYVTLSVMWLIPDRRIERIVRAGESRPSIAKRSKKVSTRVQPK